MRHRGVKPIFGLIFTLCSVAAHSQSMVIKGATILDVTNGDMIKNHVVIVKDGRIGLVQRSC